MPASARELWLAALERLAGRTAHEIRNPLNGAVVNLEVLRSRLARPGADRSSLASFAETASQELTRTARLVDALLAVSRSPVSSTVDLMTVLDPLVLLYGALAERGGGSVTVESRSGSPATNPVDALSARLAIAAILEAATNGPSAVRCEVERRANATALGVARGGGPVELPAEVREVAEQAGIRFEERRNVVWVLFPAPGAVNLDAS